MGRRTIVLLALVGMVLAACAGGEVTSISKAPDAVAEGPPCGSVGGLAARRGATGQLTPPPPTSAALPRLLVFSRTTGFRHPAIDDAKRYFSELDAEGRYEVTLSEDPSDLHGDALDEIDVVVFANTTGDALDDPAQDAFRSFIEEGGRFVGVHSAADTEHDWDWYGEMLGAQFFSHPPLLQDVTLSVEHPEHPSMVHLPAEFDFREEYYNYDRPPRPDVDVLLTLDASTATIMGGASAADAFLHGSAHPVAWVRQEGLGRIFYTNLGHTPATWDVDWFRDHLTAGIDWTLDDARWRRTVITEDVDGAVGLRVAPSGHVFWIERSGVVRLYDPAAAIVTEVAELDVAVQGEGGLIGLELTPDVAESGEVLLYWTRPATAASDTEWENVLQRMTLDADCRLDPASAVDLLVVPNDGPSHQAGEIRFHPEGTILLATGDNTDNVDDGFAPIDGRPGAETSDARRTSGSSADLRGAILRLTPDGEPAPGNLADIDPQAAPEVWVTGVRNPYRLAVDPGTGEVWWGDIGPDAALPGERGPQGFDELNRAASPGDGGWPFCIGDLAYSEFDPATGTVGEEFDCAGTIAPVFAYDYAGVIDADLGSSVLPAVGEFGGGVEGRALMAGPFVTPDDGPFAPPVEGLVLHEFSRNELLTVTTDAEGRLDDLDAVAPFLDVNTPIDVEQAPDGSWYILEYGSWTEVTTGAPALTRIDHAPDGRFPDLAPPVVAARSVATTDGAELYQLNCAGCHGIDGTGGRAPSFAGVGERLSIEEHVAVVTSGRGEMPAFGAALSDAQIEAVVAYERRELDGG